MVLLPQDIHSIIFYDAIAGNVDDPEGALDALMQVYVYVWVGDVVQRKSTNI